MSRWQVPGAESSSLIPIQPQVNGHWNFAESLPQAQIHRCRIDGIAIEDEKGFDLPCLNVGDQGLYRLAARLRPLEILDCLPRVAQPFIQGVCDRMHERRLGRSYQNQRSSPLGLELSCQRRLVVGESLRE